MSHVFHVREAVGYAMAQSEKIWRENGRVGSPDPAWYREWIPYHLDQQWRLGMLGVGSFSAEPEVKVVE